MEDQPATLALGAPLAAPSAAPSLPERYRDLGLLGSGGMGEVRRVQDRLLRRTLAMKLLRRDALGNVDAAARFACEARVTARLQHPGIIVIHDHGVLADGRPWLTMPELQGRTLAQLLAEPPPDEPARTRDRMALFLQVCEALAFAHGRGVVHRDIKPQNLMIDAHGGVVILDWGIARAVGSPDEVVSGEDSVDPRAPETQHGRVIGSPGYIPPEGHFTPDPRADVWALGNVLHQMLYGEMPGAALEAGAGGVVAAGPAAASAAAWAYTPPALRDACAQALATDPLQRPADAGALAAPIRAWLNAVRHLDEAGDRMREAAALLGEIAANRAAAAQLQAAGEAQLVTLAPHAPEEEKRPAWAQLDAAEAAELAAVAGEIAWEGILGSVLQLVPGHADARRQLAAHYRIASERAHAARQEGHALRLEALVRTHDRGEHRAWLQGDARLDLTTDPAEATVEIHRYVRDGRRLVAQAVETVAAPIVARVLPAGSYLLVLRAPGCSPARLPVRLERGGHWRNCPPESKEAQPFRLLPAGAVGPEEVYVPAGWFTAGGDPEAPEALPRARVWLDGFVMMRTPVTNAQYLRFLDALAPEDAARWAPRAAGQGEGDHPLMARGPDGRFGLCTPPDSVPWALDWPVTMVSWHAAQAYAAWAAASGLPWRLPTELEWEKAARGVDERHFPWGDHADPTWARMVNSLPDRAERAAVTAHPLDESPYGVAGLGGNVRDWCADAYVRGGAPILDGRPQLPTEGAYRVVRGGSWASAARLCRAAIRFADKPDARFSATGFRLVRPV